MSGFSVDWLDLRETADRGARDAGLLEQAKHWLRGNPSSDRRPTIVDLGAGTGSTLRAFAESDDFSPNGIEWLLVDQDRPLLAEARRRHGHSHAVETCELDLAKFSDLPLACARLVAASALFDLVSAEFVDSLAIHLETLCQRQPVGLYTALNYDGTTDWTPTHPLDDAVLEAFNRDQQRDKGFGPALGPDACGYLQRRFVEAGFEVSSAHSPWILDGADRSMMTELITGIAAAVAKTPAMDSDSLKDWLEFRLDKVNDSSCIVGHTDMLALPRGDSI
jgi:hypothetical protein